MKHAYLAAHFIGFVMWMGGGLCAMMLGIAMRRAPKSDLGTLVGVQARLHRALILPGSTLVVLSGLLLTLRLYGSATSVSGYPMGLMVMQGTGLLAAIIVLVVSFPTMSRLARLDPTGDHGPLFQALSRKMGMAGMLAGLLAFTALISGVLLL